MTNCWVMAKNMYVWGHSDLWPFTTKIYSFHPCAWVGGCPNFWAKNSIKAFLRYRIHGNGTHDITAKLTFNLWPPEWNQFILESKFPQICCDIVLTKMGLADNLKNIMPPRAMAISCAVATPRSPPQNTGGWGWFLSENNLLQFRDRVGLIYGSAVMGGLKFRVRQSDRLWYWIRLN